MATAPMSAMAMILVSALVLVSVLLPLAAAMMEFE
jgi:hypothetical protein